MERKSRSLVVSIRVPEGLLERVEKDVEENGDHASRADWIIAAMREYEKQRAKLIAERKIAESETAERQAADLGSVSCRTSTESNAN